MGHDHQGRGEFGGMRSEGYDRNYHIISGNGDNIGPSLS